MGRYLCLRSARGLLVFFSTTILVFTGCTPAGTKKVTIHGTITYQGQPLQSGLLAFHGPGDTYASASVQPNGTFTIALAPGEVTVNILETPSGSKVRPAPNPPITVPEKYASPESSGLRYTITLSTTKLPIELQ